MPQEWQLNRLKLLESPRRNKLTELLLRRLGSREELPSVKSRESPRKKSKKGWPRNRRPPESLSRRMKPKELQSKKRQKLRKLRMRWSR